MNKRITLGIAAASMAQTSSDASATYMAQPMNKRLRLNSSAPGMTSTMDGQFPPNPQGEDIPLKDK
jgi:hypothetical protein